MGRLSLLIKPASSLCNMRCKYCFYADESSLREVSSFGLMTPETTEKMIENVYRDLRDGDQVTFAFQGGEPTLAGLDYFRRFTTLVKSQDKKVAVDYALQTNGLLLDDDWCAFLRENRFLVGLSLDGKGEFHDQNRVDDRGRGTYQRVLAAKERLERHEVPTNILWVLTNHQARYPQRVWSFLEQQKIDYVQFIPCLAPLEEEKPSPYGLTPERFASFYTQLFRLWAEEFARGNYRSVKLFDDLLNLLTRGQVNACGLTGQCQVQYVVEADGGVYPCDFFVLDQWQCGNLAQSTPKELRNAPAAERFLARERTDSPLCQGCRYRRLCGGGCPRMKESMYLAPDQSFCGYQRFLDDSWPLIQDVARRLS